MRFSRVDDPAAPPSCPIEMTEIIARPGIDGVAIETLGRRGEPFQMITAVDVLTKLAAHDLLRDYRNTIGAGNYRLVYGDVDYHTRYGIDFIVLRVDRQTVKKLGAQVGGLTGASSGKFWTAAVWTLIGVEVSQ